MAGEGAAASGMDTSVNERIGVSLGLGSGLGTGAAAARAALPSNTSRELDVLNARVRALEARAKAAEAEAAEAKASSPWWGRHCDGCGRDGKKSTGPRFVCTTCPAKDFCLACIGSGEKTCNHAYYVLRAVPPMRGYVYPDRRTGAPAHEPGAAGPRFAF